ncbi:MAG: DNA-directed DNA polymerase I [Thermoproteota archaeon]|nr:DNA-directed DNA polymerase I [Thermoproteota archaeon]
MSQRCLDQFSTALKKEPEKTLQPVTKRVEERKWVFPPLAPENLSPSYLVSASYDGDRRKACIKLYEPKSQRIYFWYDNTGHQPYCLTNLSPLDLEKIERLKAHPGLDHFELVEKYNALVDRPMKVTKVVAKDPLAIGGRARGCIRDIIPEEYSTIAGEEIAEKVKVWEAVIKYYQCYIYDRNLSPGMLYRVEDSNLVEARLEHPEKTVKRICSLFPDASKEEGEYMERWARLLEYPAPEFRRVALDIEVYSPVSNRVPDPKTAEYPITCVSLLGSDGCKRVLLLRRKGVQEGKEKLPEDVRVKYFDSEKRLIRVVFDILWDYPFVLTFNGDNFDLPYLAHRAQKFGLTRNEIPIRLGRRVSLLKYGVHLDLYKFFFNRSIKGYAFGDRYRDITLDEVGQTLVGSGKLELSKPFRDLAYSELARYCYRDAEITFQLTHFQDDLVMKLVLTLARISHLPMEDVSRLGVSRWIRSFMHHEHRRRGMLIPNTEDILELKGETVTEAIIKGKKYKGAIVVEPVPGVHFNVAVMDFASLYPSIIKVWNLGYQSIRCSHKECRDNMVPDTSHWICKKHRALESLLIGSLRDLRVEWYKPRAKDISLPSDLRNWYNVIQSALKVILNASYGVFGSDSFDLYCPPVAEATAAIARHAIQQIIGKAEELGVEVIYGDTDSVFLKNPREEQIETLADWSLSKLKMSLDVDKQYRYAVFSSRKKNYLGVLEDGEVDVKGMTGKKRHIPKFIRQAFNEMKERLAKVKTPEDFFEAKKDIRRIVRNRYVQLKERNWDSLKDLAFHVTLGKELDRYRKTTPQHVKAAQILQEKTDVEVKVGDLISFVKTVSEPHVTPVELASDRMVDVDKYVGYLQSTFDQVLDAMGLDFEEIIGLTKLERFM